MKELPEKEVLAQLEEASAPATVALTRAQKLCIIIGPLDMPGLLGAATVIGCLKYGAFFFALCCLGKIPGGAPFRVVSNMVQACVGCMSATRLLKFS